MCHRSDTVVVFAYLTFINARINPRPPEMNVDFRLVFQWPTCSVVSVQRTCTSRKCQIEIYSAQMQYLYLSARTRPVVIGLLVTTTFTCIILPPIELIRTLVQVKIRVFSSLINPICLLGCTRQGCIPRLK